ncbi:hypothetical protein K2173_016451 [Erythroxylum novogranatense]|uniref:HXXXD-type acyl-transferase family protein n=1 Tax=Erythroxylum novogranatense TaxID=1862640 RepID=A0AAV8SGE9_9ROSI|nr:hypothetical protein K2173_016451 [Erythroxylum novogranatense]
MVNVRILSTSTVRAQSHQPNQPSPKVELTPWDLQFLLVGPIQKGLLFHKPKFSQDNACMIIRRLETSLSRTLDFFAPLAGRLATVELGSGNTSFYINCNNAGAFFVRAVADDVTMADVVEPVFVPDIVHSFFALNGSTNYEGISSPLLAVQVTELVDGFFIGCTISHAVADGTSFWHFFNSWSEICRGFLKPSKPPVLERWFPDGTDYPIGLISKMKPGKFTSPILKERVFHFTRQGIAELKAKANSEIGTNKISSLQALLSHIWRCVVRCQSPDSDQEVSFKLLIGVRPRLKPPLPEGYFGNAVQVGPLTMAAKELQELGHGHAAWKMNKTVAWHTEDKLCNFYKAWIKDPKLPTMNSVTTNALVTSSSPRFDVYGNDFGWGKPVAVRSGSGNKNDGKITVFAGVEEGSVDAEVCLLPETLERLGNDTEFMATVSVPDKLMPK